MAWKCDLLPKGCECPYEKFETLGCAKLNLAKACQEFKWSLPIIGPYYKEREPRVKCENWKK